MRALDQVDALKTHLPMLGSIVSGDFEKARQTALPDAMSSVEDVTAELIGYLRGMTIFGHPRTQQNVVPPPTIPSVKVLEAREKVAGNGTGTTASNGA